MKIIRENSLPTSGFKSAPSLIDENSSVYDGLVCSEYNIVKMFEDKSCAILNTLTDSVVLLSPQETSSFLAFQDGVCEDAFFVGVLYRLGIVVPDRNNEREIIESLKKEVFLSGADCPIVTILPTQVCNARCGYCFAEHNQKITMSSSVVENVIAFFASNFNSGDKVAIRWFGGEPLTAEPIIDNIIEGIDKRFSGELDFESIMFSNGSLLNEQLIRKAYGKWRLKDFRITIDGYADEHNRRKNYFDRDSDYYSKMLFDIEKMLENHINVTCRINLDKDNIDQLDMILKDLASFNPRERLRVRVTVLRPSDCEDNSYNYIVPSELSWAYRIIYNKLFEYGFAKSVVAMLPRRMRQGCIYKNLNKIIIGADGNLYKCLQQNLSPKNAVGSVMDDINISEFVNYFSLPSIPKGCESCKFLPMCLGGCNEYWKLKKTETISPCIREKYFMDLLFDYINHEDKLEV